MEVGGYGGCDSYGKPCVFLHPHPGEIGMRDKGPISCLQLLRPAGILFLTSTEFDSLKRLLPPFLLSPASCSLELVKKDGWEPPQHC